MIVPPGYTHAVLYHAGKPLRGFRKSSARP